MEFRSRRNEAVPPGRCDVSGARRSCSRSGYWACLGNSATVGVESLVARRLCIVGWNGIWCNKTVKVIYQSSSTWHLIIFNEFYILTSENLMKYKYNVPRKIQRVSLWIHQYCQSVWVSLVPRVGGGLLLSVASHEYICLLFVWSKETTTGGAWII